jgi:hypothetical protein
MLMPCVWHVLRGLAGAMLPKLPIIIYRIVLAGVPAYFALSGIVTAVGLRIYSSHLSARD